jgi:hypothetical protein
MAVANSCKGSPSSWVRVLNWWWYPVARCLSPNRSLSAPIVFSYIAPLGSPCRISETWPCRAVHVVSLHSTLLWPLTVVFISSRPVLISTLICSWPAYVVASVFPRQASITSWQAFIHHDLHFLSMGIHLGFHFL